MEDVEGGGVDVVGAEGTREPPGVRSIRSRSLRRRWAIARLFTGSVPGCPVAGGVGRREGS